jgi:hypothetical protein
MKDIEGIRKKARDILIHLKTAEEDSLLKLTCDVFRD